MHKIYYALLPCVFFFVWSTATPAPKTVKKEKYACEQCLGKGNDCKGAQTLKTCDYCTKLVGVVDQSTGATPVWAEAMLSIIKPGVKAKDYNGETVTIKMCVSEASIRQAGYEPRADCSEFEQMGLRGFGCTCEGNCKEPTSPNSPNKQRTTPK